MKIPSCKNFEAKEGMGVYSRWVYFREGTVGIKFAEFLDQVITGESVEVAMLLFLLEVVSDLDSRK